MTLAQLASLVGTTAQTVQRLETENMTVSTEWLEKFSQAFSVTPADLLAQHASFEIPILGCLKQEAFEKCSEQEPSHLLRLAPDLNHPLSVKLMQNIGPYAGNSYLIAEKISQDDILLEEGKDCLIEIEDGEILLRRMIKTPSEEILYIPYELQQPSYEAPQVNWAAKIVMNVAFIN